jgi:hypothetical protein
VLTNKGEHAGVAMYGGGDNSTYAFCTENGPQTVALEPLLQGNA